MLSHRQATTLAGILTITGIVAGIFSIVPAVEQKDYLTLAAEHKNQIIWGALFQSIMVPAYVGFALCLYPFLKTKNETLSVGFMGFRLMTGMLHLIGILFLPLLLVLSQKYVQAGKPNTAHFQDVGTLLRLGRDLVNHVALIFSLCLGDLLMLVILYRSKWIPRWLSIWGFLGIGLAIVASFLVLFQMVAVVTPFYLGLNAPLGLHSIVLAIWFIAKGFDIKSQDTDQHVQTTG